jgi:hypothetical protein
MLYIIILGLFYQGQKIQECGMQWDAAIKKWVKEIKHKDAIQEHKIVKIDKE